MAVGVGASIGTLGFPNVLRGATAPEVLVGHLQPLSGFLAFDGQNHKRVELLAIDEINEAGGIKSLGGAKLKLLDADSEGKPNRAFVLEEGRIPLS